MNETIRKIDSKFKDSLWPGMDYLTGSYNKLSLPRSKSGVASTLLTNEGIIQEFKDSER